MVKSPKSWTAPGDPKPELPKPPRPEPGWRARAWKRMLDEGVYENQSELARGEGVTAAAVSRGLQKLRGEVPRKREEPAARRAPNRFSAQPSCG